MMLWEVEAPGLVEIFTVNKLNVTVKAAFTDSAVDADSLSAFAPFQLIGSSKPLPVLRATVIPFPFFHTLSGRPSELMSIRLYSSSFSEVTMPKPAEKLPEALLIPVPTPRLYERLLPLWMRSSSQSIGSVKA